MFRHFCYDDQLSLGSENHIYEEIDSDMFTTCDEGSDVEESFLLSISPGRRKNLKIYGCTGWELDNEN